MTSAVTRTVRSAVGSVENVMIDILKSKLRGLNGDQSGAIAMLVLAAGWWYLTQG